MSDVTKEQILDALRHVIDPDLGRDIVSLGFVTTASACDGAVKAVINLTTPACPVKDQLRGQAETLLRAIPGVKSVNVEMTAVSKPKRKPPKPTVMDQRMSLLFIFFVLNVL